ncbi:MAG TPA: Abi-alpha family protein [Aldersonia sp.]
MTPDEKPRRDPADDAPRRSVAAGLFHALSTLGRAPLHRATDIATTVAAPLTSIGAAPARASDLRQQGIELSERSDIDEQHPAFARMLDELTPDEARIVRFLSVAGPQPSIDVRTKTLFQAGSQSLASGVNLIARMAGCRRPERDRLYLANLDRLGLVRFSAEPVADYRRYALLEVQPRALEAMSGAVRTISIYRSICLSVLGEEFCACCFDTDGYHGGGWDTDPRRDKIIGKGPPPRR